MIPTKIFQHYFVVTSVKVLHILESFLTLPLNIPFSEYTHSLLNTVLGFIFFFFFFCFPRTKCMMLIFRKRGKKKKKSFQHENIFNFFFLLFFRLTVRVGRKGKKNPGSIPVASFESELYTIYHDIWKRGPHRLVFVDFRENRWKWRDDVDMEAGFNLFILCQIVKKPSSSVSTYHHPTNLSTSYISYLASYCSFWLKLIIFSDCIADRICDFFSKEEGGGERTENNWK